MTTLMTEWCNPYGVETGGAARLLGGLSDASKVFHQWACKIPSIGHFRMMCEHGHKGQMMPQCANHAKQFKTRDMQFCPRCNIPPNDHRCQLSLTEIS
jgi:hypothetical protein